MDASNRHKGKLTKDPLSGSNPWLLVEGLMEMLAAIKPQLKYLPGLTPMNGLNVLRGAIGVQYPSEFPIGSPKTYEKIRVVQFGAIERESHDCSCLFYLSDKGHIFRITQWWPGRWSSIAITYLDPKTLAEVLADKETRHAFYSGLASLLTTAIEKRQQMERQFGTRFVDTVSSLVETLGIRTTGGDKA